MEQVFVMSLPQKLVMLEDLWANDPYMNILEHFLIIKNDFRVLEYFFVKC